MLILKQNAANTVPTPAAGKGTIFLSDADVLSVKNSSGVVESFPTVGGSNTQVMFNDNGALAGNVNFVFDKDTSVLTITGNVAATRVLTDNLLYANGAAWDLQEPAGSNGQVQWNNDGQFGASANFSFDNGTNTLTVDTLSATDVSATTLAGSLTTAAQPNITSVGTLTGLSVSGDALVGGNLVVDGNLTYVNVDNLVVEDPLIELGTGPNGSPLTTDDGKDRGTVLHYYSGGDIQAFMGWDNSNAEFAFGSDVTVANDVVTFNTLGNVRADLFIGNGSALSALTGANVTGEVANANFATYSGTSNIANVAYSVDGANVSGEVATANTVSNPAQANITSVGTLTSLLIGSGTSGDYTNAKLVSATANGAILGVTDNIGVVGEAHGDGANSNVVGIGVYGVGQTANSTRAAGVRGDAFVSATGDTGAAVGVRGHATQTHSGGYNIGLLGVANNSGIANYALYLQEGDIASIENNVNWDLVDNSDSALTFGSTGKANIFLIETTDNAEGIATTGYLNVTGNATVGGIKTDNYYYANGAPLDMQQPAGSNTQVQYNNNDDFGASSAFTFNSGTNTLSVTNVSATDVSATTVGGTLTTAAQPNITSVGTLTSLDVTGNVGAGNVSATDVSGTTLGGTLTTAAQPNVTSVGTLSSLDVTGNVGAGNVSATAGDFTSVSGNGSALSALTGANVTGEVSFAATANAVAGSNVSGEVSFAATANAVAGANVSGEVAFAATANAVAGANVSGTVANATYAVSAGTAGTVTTAAQPNITTVGTLSSLSVAGNVSAGNVSATEGAFTYVTGDGANLSAITGANVTGEVAFAATANAVAGANVSGQVANALVAGTVYTAAQPNITSVGTLSSLAVTGNATVSGNVITDDVRGRTNANLTISAFSGNNSILLAPTGTGVIDVGAARVVNGADPTAAKDLATKEYVDTIASASLHYHAPVRVESPVNLNATYNNGSSGVGATLTNAGANAALVIDGVTVSTNDRVLIYEQTDQTQNGVYVVTTEGDGSTQWVLTRASDADTYSPSDPDSFGAGDAFFVQEGATGAGELYVMNTEGTITFGTTNITFVQISSSQIYQAGTGLDLTGVTFSLANTAVSPASYGDAGNVSTFTVDQQGRLTAAGETAIQAPASGITGSTLSSNVTTSSLTSVGTLGSLNVSGNANVGNIGATNFVGSGASLTSLNASNLSSGTVPSGRLSGSYSISVDSATTAGTVTTAAQPNITSVGTLTGLTIAANGDITMSGTGSQISGVALVSSTLFAGSGANLTNLNGSNISSGTIAAARIATLNQNTTGYAATVSSAAQPNITSVGTLTSLTVSGNANVGNIGATNFVGSGASLTSLNGSNITSGTIAAARVATLNQNTTGYAATVSSAAQPNITSVGTLTSLAISGTNTLTVRTISTGANTTTGTITGNWSLSSGSRLNATYADLAEKYTADQQYEPGTVVVFGGEAELSITGSKGSHAVAGIVTTNPAQVYNADLVAPEGQFVVELALIGRVPCKVIGPVNKGDLIIASDNAGFGCAADPDTVKPGTIIGKAIESYNGDTPDGIVEVLVGKN